MTLPESADFARTLWSVGLVAMGLPLTRYVLRGTYGKADVDVAHAIVAPAGVALGSPLSADAGGGVTDRLVPRRPPQRLATTTSTPATIMPHSRELVSP